MADQKQSASPAEQNAAGVSVQEPDTSRDTKPKRETRPGEPEELPRYRVLLHNDDVNEFDYVIRTVYRLTPLSLDEATHRTWEAHTRGVSLLLVTHKERAELYVDQFASAGITVTAEPEN